MNFFAALRDDDDRERRHIQGVLAQQIPEILSDIIPMLKRVIDKSTGFTLEGVLCSILSGEKQLWIIGDFEGLTITHVQDRYTERVLWVDWLVGSNMPKWYLDWADFQENMAKDLGCKSIEFNGRRGYKKFEKLYPKCKPIRTLYRQEV